MNEFFLHMVDVVINELLGKSCMRPKVGGSRVGLEFVFCNRETYHKNLY